MDVERFLTHLCDTPFYTGQIVGRFDYPARAGVFAEDMLPAPPSVRPSLAALGVERLYAHQARALRAIHAGGDIVLYGGHSGGKSLCFQIPIVSGILASPVRTALVVCPFKPVAQAQARCFRRMARAAHELDYAVSTFDGDLQQRQRSEKRKCPIIITNPDMLHRSILPNHPRWADFFSRLHLVAVEELHCYSGLFGANAANVFRRLSRVCEHYGARPQFVATSSTLANPKEAAERLIGRRFETVPADTAPCAPRTYLLWRPEKDPPTAEAGHLMGQLVHAGIGVIAFSRASSSCELIAEYARAFLVDKGGTAPGRVRAYRGGYLPGERRAIEDDFHESEVLGVSSTGVLELGLHVPQVEAVLICGWPGSVSSFFQQSARAGRSGRPSLTVFIALHDPVNRFLLSHPDYIFDRSFGAAVIERENPHVLAGHLRCAANELPVKPEEADLFGQTMLPVLSVLEDRGKVLEKGGMWISCSGENPAGDLPLRGYFDRNVVIQDAQSGRVVGEVDWLSAHSLVHAGAIYLHEDRAYLVEEFNREDRFASVRPAEVDYYTNPLGRSFVQKVDACLRERDLGGGQAFLGEVTVGVVTEGYEERCYRTNVLIRSVGLDLPPVTLETMALWICTSPVRDAEFAALGLNRDLYGLSNSLRLVLPLFMACDVLDLRPWPGRTNFPWQALYFYERYPRGLGFSERVFEQVEAVLDATEKNLSECTCKDGCPLCVGDPVRPYMVNNPELEADLIPSRREVLLLVRALRSRAVIEELLARTWGRSAAADALSGRMTLLQEQRREAMREPPRHLPADAPAGSVPMTGPQMPLQLKRGVRRRIEKMRMPEGATSYRDIREAAVPEPETPGSLAMPDAEIRRARNQAAASRRRQPGSSRPPSGPGEKDSRKDAIVAEALRRVGERKRDRKRRR